MDLQAVPAVAAGWFWFCCFVSVIDYRILAGGFYCEFSGCDFLRIHLTIQVSFVVFRHYVTGGLKPLAFLEKIKRRQPESNVRMACQSEFD